PEAARELPEIVAAEPQARARLEQPRGREVRHAELARETRAGVGHDLEQAERAGRRGGGGLVAALLAQPREPQRAADAGSIAERLGQRIAVGVGPGELEERARRAGRPAREPLAVGGDDEALRAAPVAGRGVELAEREPIVEAGRASRETR